MLKNLNKILLIKVGEMAEWFKAADCKSVENSHHRFESYSLLIITTINYFIYNNEI